MSAQPVGVDDVPVPPTFLYRPPRARSLLPKVLQVCESVGRLHEPEQALAVDVVSGLKADGAPASLEAAVIAARQNLKTYVLENIVLTRLVDPADPSELFFWTSQQIDTCEETFLHFLAIFDSDEHPHMKRRFKRAVTTNGKQMIELRSGRRLKFKARSEKSGQGFAGDVIVFDEAFALEDEHMGALLPTLSTRRRATVLYGSSAGHGSSAVLRGVRDRGRKGGRGAPAYVEWCAPGSLSEPGCEFPGCRHTKGMQGCALDRRELIQMANPMAGRRITWGYLGDEREAFPPLKYARERLGWWDEPDGGDVPPVSVQAWRARMDPASAIADGGRIVLAAEIALDRKSGSIAAAGWRDDGAAHVGLIAHDGGADWLADRLIEVAGRHQLLELDRGAGGKRRMCPGIVLDPTSPAGSLVEPLRRAGIEPVLLSTREVAAAYAGLQDRLAAEGAESVWHRDAPAVDVAIDGAIRRDLGDGGWALGRRKSAAVSVDITPAVAVTEALWALTQARARVLPRIF